MKKVLVMIDSFKGTITSKELGEITKKELEKKNVKCDAFPISDGGDGFLDSISVLLPLEKINLKCHDPFFREIDAYYLFDRKTNTAYIELAQSSGINLVKKEELNPFIASTYGLGEVIFDAIKKGAKHIALGVGGSATDDGGTGMLSALGVKFLNNDGNKIDKISNGKMREISKIDITQFQKNISGVDFLVLNDVTNPLLGKTGATYIFAPQKGAKYSDLPILEDNMLHYSNVVKSTLNCDEVNYPGSGAVGGCGYALRCFMKAKFIPGIKFILDLLEIEHNLSEYDTIISGEGKIDNQTLDGKVISGIMSRFKGHNKILVCALNELDDLQDAKIYSIIPKYATYEESLKEPEKYFELMVKDLEV